MRMTQVRTRVAKSEATCSTPTLAKIAVNAAKAGERSAEEPYRPRTAWQAGQGAGLTRRGRTRPRQKPASGRALSRPLHRAGIHLAVSGDWAAGFRPSRHRLCAGQMAARIEVAEA